MNNLYKLKRNFSFKMLLTVFILVLCNSFLYADGSKNLYPSGKAGYRAYLRSSLTADTERWPFPTNGTHYVYAKAGERITLASSAQGAGSAAIRLYNTSGTLLFSDTSGGQITNRDQEKAGPKLSGETSTTKYTPIYYQIPTGGDGIYRVEFLARGTGDPSATVLADANWSQLGNAGILAWDVSVINTANTAFISGRVYATLLNMSNGTGNPNSNGFYGIVYGLTDDGFTYRINNNGNNGLYFSFFINNNGFTDANGVSIYKSLTKTNLSSTDVQNPTSADIINDNTQQVTHKIFYTLPDPNLPATSIGAVPGGSTWLKKVPLVPVVTQLSTEGVEGTQGQISSKGGYIKFTSNRPAKYTIVITSSTTPAAFTQRVLTGFTSVSTNSNSILWDGKDGAGQPLPAGTHQAQISVQLQGAEVHFPYIDMEYNQNGTIIELLDKNNLSQVESSIVYWNDTDIPNVTNGTVSSPKNNTHLPPTNSTGIDSNSNGHKWGVNATGTGGQFGDQKSMDTWAFVKGPMETQPLPIVTRVADLKISSVVSDKTAVIPGDVATFYIKAKNDGPSAVTGSKFTFTHPVGLNPQSVVFDGKGCGTESVVMTYNASTRTYTSSLDLPNGCEIAYTIKMVVTSSMSTGNQNFRAGILRPNDVTDPDATNPDPSVLPTDAQAECTNNGMGGTCNNVKNSQLSYTSAAVCTEQVNGENFTATGGASKTFNQPATTYGFVLDIYSLDNSFNMTVNGVSIATSELQFQSAGTPAPGINVRFADGDQYEVNTPTIVSYSGTASAPLIRVMISNTGAISMYGSKTAGGVLFPLELFNGNSFNTIPWNTASGNTITVTQNVVGTTNIIGRGYGQNITACACYNLPNTTTTGIASQHGITLLNRAGASNGNWPMIRTGAHTVLESNTKGFVVTRIPTTGISSITTPVDGMMIYDTTAKCLKIYTVDTVVPANTGWSCFTTPACP